jgi:hypothetical protein
VPDGEAQYWSYLALLNVDNSGANDLVRFGQWCQASTGNANGLTTKSTTDLGIGLNGAMATVMASYRLEANSDVTISMTVGSSTFSQTYTGGIARPSSVEVGLRLYPTGGSFNLDSFTVVPEPASLGLIGVSGLALMRRKRA